MPCKLKSHSCKTSSAVRTFNLQPSTFNLQLISTQSKLAHDHSSFPNHEHAYQRRLRVIFFGNVCSIKNDQSANQHLVHKRCGNNPRKYRSFLSGIACVSHPSSPAPPGRSEEHT